MGAYPHAFEARVVHHDLGTYRDTVVFLPPEVAARLPLDAHPRLRVSGEVGDVPFSGAWQPVRGRWYLMLSKALLRDAGLAVGDWAAVRFRVEDQETVELPPPLAVALGADAATLAAWEALPAGAAASPTASPPPGRTSP